MRVHDAVGGRDIHFLAEKHFNSIYFSVVIGDIVTTRIVYLFSLNKHSRSHATRDVDWDSHIIGARKCERHYVKDGVMARWQKSARLVKFTVAFTQQ